MVYSELIKILTVMAQNRIYLESFLNVSVTSAIHSGNLEVIQDLVDLYSIQVKLLAVRDRSLFMPEGGPGEC
jgi:hypothetical protein